MTVLEIASRVSFARSGFASFCRETFVSERSRRLVSSRTVMLDLEMKQLTE